MYGEAFARCCELWQQAVVRAGHGVDVVDIERLGSTMSFVTDLTASSYEQACESLHTRRIVYTVAAATTLARDVRQLLIAGDVNPLFELPDKLVDRLGIFVFPIANSRISSGCALFEKTPFIFVSRELGTDQLSECARTLAALILESSRRGLENFAAIERIDSDERPRGPRTYFVDNFASELLVPTRGLGVSLKKLRQLLNVKRSEVGDAEILYAARIFGVSFSAVARRCERTELLPLGGAAALERFLVENFGGPEQRASELQLPPMPSVPFPSVPTALLTVISQHLAANTVSHADAAADLGIALAELVSLLRQLQR